MGFSIGNPFKSVGKAVKSIAHGLKNFNDNVGDKLAHYGNPSHWMKDNVKMPKGPDQPLMPDYAEIDRARRRSRARKLGRVETIMTDSLG